MIPIEVAGPRNGPEFARNRMEPARPRHVLATRNPFYTSERQAIDRLERKWGCQKG